MAQYFLMLVGMVSVQFGATLAKKLFPVLGPGGITLYRLSLASLILCIAWRPWRQPVTRAELKKIAAYGFSLGMMNLLFYLCIERIPLGIAVAIEFAGPLSVAIYYSRKALDFLWALLAAIGIFMLVPHGALESNIDPVGAAFALGAGVFWALYILSVRHASTTMKGSTASALGMGMAAFFVLPYGVASAGVTGLWRPDAFLAALGVAVFSSVLPYSIDMHVMKRITAKTFSVFLSLAPAMAAVVGWVALGEKLTLSQWVAVCCVVAASMGSAVSSRRAQLRVKTAENAAN